MHGRATVTISSGDEPEDWSFTGSATSAVLLNHIATNANNKGFGVDDDNGNIVQYVTVWHCAKNSAGSHGTTPTTAATTARSSSRTTKTATQRKPWSIHRALPHVQRHDAARHHAPAALRRVDIGRVALPEYKTPIRFSACSSSNWRWPMHTCDQMTSSRFRCLFPSYTFFKCTYKHNALWLAQRLQKPP